jgi:hypothetical protein
VPSIEFECLHRIIPLGERHLRRAISEYVGHYHHERNHQGLDNELIRVLHRTSGPRTDNASRVAVVLLSQFVEWRELLTIVRPDTLVRWHRDLFHLSWRVKSRQRGRPRIPIEMQRLIGGDGGGSQSHLG